VFLWAEGHRWRERVTANRKELSNFLFADNSSRVECYCKCLLAMRNQFRAVNSARSTLFHCAPRGAIRQTPSRLKV